MPGLQYFQYLGGTIARRAEKLQRRAFILIDYLINRIKGNKNRKYDYSDSPPGPVSGPVTGPRNRPFELYRDGSARQPGRGD